MDQKGSIDQSYKLDKKLDIYSIEDLMWQISSGCQPFYINGADYGVGLSMELVKGKREKVIYGTLIEYSNLYKGK